ncbi:MAG: hypothetical protein CM15mP109_01330 [Candidatus Dadabacteria bacterium]|nr:MAG: hypothetical protein CM15mP109_01330 [Candidatus Dadabacteria bacterium]
MVCLLSRKKSRGGFVFFAQSRGFEEIEINKIVNAIKLAGMKKNIESIVIDLSNFFGGVSSGIYFIFSEIFLKI